MKNNCIHNLMIFKFIQSPSLFQVFCIKIWSNFFGATEIKVVGKKMRVKSESNIELKKYWNN